MIISFKEIGKKDIKRVMPIYISNKEYFLLSSKALPNNKTVYNDMQRIPHNLKKSYKKYMLIIINHLDIGVIDLLYHYPLLNGVYIGLFLIKKEYQRQGLGNKVIDFLVNTFMKLGFLKIRLAVMKVNTQALAFWEKNGFFFIKEGQVNINGIIEEVIIMERNIK